MEMQQGFAVGGKKNQGLGRVRMTGYTVSYFDPQSMVEPYSLREFLVARGALKPVENRADFETQLAAYFEQVCPA
jgi:hypothetical protein